MLSVADRSGKIRICKQVENFWEYEIENVEISLIEEKTQTDNHLYGSLQQYKSRLHRVKQQMIFIGITSTLQTAQNNAK